MILDDQLAGLWGAGATLAQIEQATGLTRGVTIGRAYGRVDRALEGAGPLSVEPLTASRKTS